VKHWVNRSATRSDTATSKSGVFEKHGFYLAVSGQRGAVAVEGTNLSRQLQTQQGHEAIDMSPTSIAPLRAATVPGTDLLDITPSGLVIGRPVDWQD